LNREIAALLDIALPAIAQACAVARRVQQQSVPIARLEKADHSPVTVADFAAQAIVAHALSTALGPLRLVAEESAALLRGPGQRGLTDKVVAAVRQVWPGAGHEQVLGAIDAGDHDALADAYWTLDPVDGTKGFLRGGQYAISLARIEGGEVLLGLIGCPNLSPDLGRPFTDPDPRGLIYFAGRGDGSWQIPADMPGAEPLAVRRPPVQAGATIRVCESVESAHSRHDQTARILERLGGASEPVRLDSQCKYAVVARGQADAYLRLPTRGDYVENIWDHAAGMLVAAEAGAVVSDVRGAPLDFSCGAGLRRNRGIVCAAPEYHADIVRTIRELKLDGRTAI